MIEGVRITPLRQIPDERGKIMHMMRASDPHFQKFGEVYFATAYPGAIKAWHRHKKQIQNYAVLQGMAKVVIYDDRKGSKTFGEIQEVFMGEDNYVLLTIPTEVLNGWKAIGTQTVLLANCTTETHDPTEMERVDPFSPDIPYDWALKHR